MARLTFAALLLLLVSGCSHKQHITSYKVEGKVVGIDAARHELMIDAKAIPGFMEAMTMSYPVPDQQAFSSVKTGDQVEATLQVTDDNKMWLEHLQKVPAPK